MAFDPFGIYKFHQEIRDRIESGEPGLAQSSIGSELASYVVDEGGYGRFYGNISAGEDALSELMIDVARNEGIASSRVFSRQRVEWMIQDRQAHPPMFEKKHAEAAALQKLLYNRPELFF